MPADIRNFFGGGGNSFGQAQHKKITNGAKPKKQQRGRKIVSDDDEDEEMKMQPKKVPRNRASTNEEPKTEETTSSAYFASTAKSKAATSTPLRPKTKASEPGTSKPTTPSKPVNGSAPSTGRRSARKRTIKNYAEDDDGDGEDLLKNEEEGNDDIYADDFAKAGRNGDDYQESSDDDIVIKQRSSKKTNGTAKTQDSDEEDIAMAEIPAHQEAEPKRKSKASTTPSNRKRKSQEADEGDEEEFIDGDDDDAPKKKSRKTSTKSTPKARASTKKEEREENKEVQAIFDSIPTVRAPTPPPRDDNRKFDWRKMNNNAAAAPTGVGSKEIPVGAENCLAGLSFVFTGVLESLGREEGIALVKKYGGKVTGAPSKRTSYVVLGTDAGPKKLETIRELGLKTVNEDGLFELIRRLPANGGDGKAAEQYAEKKAAEEEKIKKAAEEMERREKERAQEAAKQRKAAESRSSVPSASDKAKSRQAAPDSRLWVDKYAPDALNAVCGNKGLVEKLQRWLRIWHKNAHFGFKKAGADGTGIYRAAMVHGPPGIGKTTAAHLVAKLEGFDVVESNASDTRSKKLIEEGLRGVLDTTSLLGYFAGDGQKVDSTKRKMVLIMDEVDGLSAGDRGGVGAMAAVAKKTSIPIIFICNERRLPKMKPFDFLTAEFAFRRPTTDMIRSRIMTICYREGMRIPPQVIDQLIEGSNADIRQIINMISTVKLDNKNIDFNDSRAMAKAWEKHIILKPWDIVSKILRPQMFAPSSTATLNDKIELYFNDHEFSHLMLQENYLKTVPAAAAGYQGKEQNLKLLELADNAAASISDGDLVDRMIHGPQQHWSLMPTHAVFSFVRPASYVYGNFTERVGFSSWLGQNSKFGKLTRYVKEIQGHMRLRASGDRHEIRQQYMPFIWAKTVGVLRDQGKDAAQDVIDFMDSYYLTKDDYDYLLELGLGPMDEGSVKIESSAKSAFTRLYNSQSHPMPFVKASTVGGFAKLGGGAKKAKPDLEEAVDESDEDGVGVAGEAPEEQPADEEEGELDLKKDKYIQAPKKRKAAAGAGGSKAKKSKAKGRGRKSKDDDEGGEDDEDQARDSGSDDDAEPDEEERPKKAAKKSAGSGKGKGRSKKT